MTNEHANVPEYTVSELSQRLKRTVEDGFSYVRVRAEISGFKRAASGHLYMTLKDDSANMDGVCWRGVANKLAFNPEDGLEVICTGKLTTYPARSKYQMVIENMEPAGEGALMALLEERKKKLAAEGLFEASGKKPIPYLPEVIGVITSPTGAVIRDILHRLSERFPRRVIVWPVAVQGTDAQNQVAAAIKGFNSIEAGGPVPRPDVLIVARGGGSLEDLWAFNEEQVVRAAADSDIPLISAVGHETDTTLIDYASDLRAPTPTAAAEKAVPVRADLIYTVSDLEGRLAKGQNTLLERKRERLDGLSRGLPRPRDILGMASQRVDDLSDRLPRSLMSLTHTLNAKLAQVAGRLSHRALSQSIEHKTQRVTDLSTRANRAVGEGLRNMGQTLDATSRMLESLSYTRVLERGYAVLYDGDGTPITKSATVGAGDVFEVQMSDGRFGAEATDGAPQKPKPVKKAAPKAKKKDAKKPDERQGNLL